MGTREHEQGRPWLQAGALCMIYLAISITLVSALSLRADAVLQAQVHGQDDLASFRRVNDTTTITVLADSDSVALLGSTPLNLSCTNITGGYYRCTYTFPQETKAPGTYAIAVQQAAGSPASATASFTVDGTPPAFTQARIAPAPGGVTAAYAAQDGAGAVPCSGIEQVSLVVDENVVATAPATGCAASGNLAATLPGIQGTVKAYLVATDRLGNAGRSTPVNLDVDTAPPTLPSRGR